MSTDLLTLAIIILLVAMGAVALTMSWRNAEKKRSEAAAKNDVLTILQRAHLSRTQMDLQVIGATVNSRFLRGPCAAVESGRLLIDTNLPYAVTSWVGEQVHVYFQFRTPTGMVYYDFYANILRVLLYKTGYALELTFPEKLNNNQKRTFVRLEPPSNLIEEVMIWYVPTQQGVPKTVGALRQAFCAEDVSVEDISAGGVRLRLNNGDILIERFNAGDLVMMHLVANNGEGRERLNLWLLGEVVLIRNDATPTTCEVSLKFRRWAAEPAQDEDFAWFPAEKGGGVPPLAAWVMLRHLEVHRSMGALQ